MAHEHEFFIGGRWVKPLSSARAELIDPSTEQAFATVAMGNAADVTGRYRPPVPPSRPFPPQA